MKFRFRFQWIPFAAVAIAVAVGVSLGQWQLRRAAEKQAIESRLSAREAAPVVSLDAEPAAIDDVEYRRVRIRGEFVRDWPVYLENRPYKGMAGFHLLMPFRINGSNMHVLVARGWAPRNVADRTHVPDIAAPSGTVEIAGVARRNPGHVLQLGSAEKLHPGAIVQNVDIAQFAQASKLTMQPWLIEQTGDAADGLVRDWPRPSAGVDKHLGYAFQWYALAVTAFLFFVVTGFRRGPNRESK